MMTRNEEDEEAPTKQPKMRTSTSNDDYATKIAHLLIENDGSSNDDCCRDERCLVALIILSNPSLIDNDTFLQLWKSYGSTTLQPFCERLLLPVPTEMTTSSNLSFQISCARLVAVLLSRILDLDDTFRSNIKKQQEEQQQQQQQQEEEEEEPPSFWLTKLLVHFLCHLPKTNPSTTIALTVQVLECLNTAASLRFESYDGKTNNTDWIPSILKHESLDALWSLYLWGMTATSREVSSDSTVKTSSSDDEQQLMEQTLHAILNKMRHDHTIIDATDNARSLEAWKRRLHSAIETFYRTIVLVIFSHSTTTSSNIDEVDDFILRWLQGTLSDLSFAKTAAKKQNNTSQSLLTFSIQQLPQHIQRSWHETLLSFAMILPSQPYARTVLSNDSKIQASVVKLILTHVVSPVGTETSEELRLLAWRTCAAWVDHCQGFDWMLMTNGDNDTPKNSDMPNANDKVLGPASYLCALMRLASGEWRIQLGYRLSLKQGEVQVPASLEPRTGIVQACAQVLASSVLYLTKLAEELEDNNKSNQRTHFISPEALLHLRDSLEDALQASANYLYQLSHNSVRIDLDQEDDVVVELLASLLSEFAVFDKQTNLDTGELMTALNLAMKSSKTVERKERIMTSLTGILEVARDDSYRTLLLREHDLIGQTMIDFLCLYWKENAAAISTTGPHLSSVPYACYMTELWWSLLEEHRSDLRLNIASGALRRVMLDWMCQILSLTNTACLNCTELNQALQSSIGCFVTLHGDKHPPSEQEGEILQRALQFCSGLP